MSHANSSSDNDYIRDDVDAEEPVSIPRTSKVSTEAAADTQRTSRSMLPRSDHLETASVQSGPHHGQSEDLKPLPRDIQSQPLCREGLAGSKVERSDSMFNGGHNPVPTLRRGINGAQTFALQTPALVPFAQTSSHMPLQPSVSDNSPTAQAKQSCPEAVHRWGAGQHPVGGHGVTPSCIISKNDNRISKSALSKTLTSASTFSNLPRVILNSHASYRGELQGVRMVSTPSNTLAFRQTAFAGNPVSSTMLDLDRDASGTLLPPHLRGQPALSSVRSPYCAGNDYQNYLVPANSYTSPQRMERVISMSSAKLKRKRLGAEIPPPAYVYVRSDNPSFNIFANGFLLYPELCFAMASQMPLRDLISLYAISKDFHVIIDSRFTTICLAQALQKAPESAQTFRFRSYREHCRNDPTSRIPHPDPRKAAQNVPRQIPSFRWVAFVLHREKVVQELMAIFAERGCPLPLRCALALKKMWALVDVPDNARRIAMVHNQHFLTNLDLYCLMCFFVKLDMVANDPVASEKRDGLRKLLLSQKNCLDVIHKVLKREMWQKKSDFIAAWVRTSMNIDNIGARELDAMTVSSILGVPRHQVGLGKYEYWGQKGAFVRSTGVRRAYLLRPDQLVMREAVRRGATFSKHLLSCFVYGYIRLDTLEDCAPREYGRRLEAWNDEDYGLDDAVGGVRALAVDDGGDPLLDLGDCDRGSRWTIRKEQVSEQEQSMRAGQDRLLRGLYEAVAKERQRGAE